LKKIVLHSWVNVLLVFVPVGIASHFAHLNPSVVFAVNAIAIIPLAGLLTYATESVAHRLGDTIGALLNVSFGNAVELIILYVRWASFSEWTRTKCLPACQWIVSRL
jgi:Ca2+:H+ antiporter